MAAGQDLASFEKRVTLKVLPNGLTVLVCERHEAPVFSFFTHVGVGSDREVPGITGLAHMFEHMAFKGTDKIGTTNYTAEKLALEKVERAYAAYDRERRKEVGSDPKKVAELEKAWKDAIAAADKYVVKEAFGEIVERQGGEGLNAFTSNEETGYFYSFPSNRVELWAYLDSERFLHPVMREFYKERDVVYEERRMSTESQPEGRLLEQFLATAFVAHPYGQPVVGWPSDLQSFSATDAVKFYRAYYVPSNMVVTVVGDVRPNDVLAMVEKYFGRLPAGPRPEPLRTVEPPQDADRTVVLHEASQPFYVEGYHKPDARDPDDAVYDVIQDLMSAGRTSRLYRALVRDKKLAAFSGGFNGFPGQKYPSLFVFFAVPTPGHKPAEVRAAVQEEIKRLKNEDVSGDELKMVKTRAKAALLRKLDNNQGLAVEMGVAQSLFGDWHELFRRVEKIDQVTAADVRRVANKTFLDSNATVGYLESTQLAGSPAKEVQQ
ncbi:MAG: pitrilysin family protein [Terriglobia bacterium]